MKPGIVLASTPQLIRAEPGHDLLVAEQQIDGVSYLLLVAWPTIVVDAPALPAEPEPAPPAEPQPVPPDPLPPEPVDPAPEPPADPEPPTDPDPPAPVDPEPVPPDPLPPAPPDPVPPVRALAWGMYYDRTRFEVGKTVKDNAPWSLDGYRALEETLGVKSAYIHYGASMYAAGRARTFDAKAADAVVAYGAIPVIDWSPWNTGAAGSWSTGGVQPEFKLRDIVTGLHDSAIDGYARGIAAWGKPVVLRLMHEMNIGKTNPQFPWQYGNAETTPLEFVLAWQYIVERVRRVASNVSWLWCPNVDYSGATARIAEYWPGAGYVDMLGLDGYNRMDGESPTPRSIKDIFCGYDRVPYNSYEQVCACDPALPVWIGETASDEYDGKGAWQRRALRDIAIELPRVTTVLWFNREYKGKRWPLDSSPEALSGAVDAFRAWKEQA